eukprot:7535459-Ditylum_brightwellii.AAC.1
MKIQDKAASSSPPGRHYGHYKATLDDTRIKANMNKITQVIWNKWLEPAAEEHKTLIPVQFGNRKGRSTVGTLLLKV